jgi:hypothetical protein
MEKKYAEKSKEDNKFSWSFGNSMKICNLEKSNKINRCKVCQRVIS